MIEVDARGVFIERFLSGLFMQNIFSPGDGDRCSFFVYEFKGAGHPVYGPKSIKNLTRMWKGVCLLLLGLLKQPCVCSRRSKNV